MLFDPRHEVRDDTQTWENFPVATDKDIINFLLRNAYEIIKVPANWTQYEVARDIGGFPTDSEGINAISFCSQGAIFRVSKLSTLGNYFFLRSAIGKLEVIMMHVPNYNDTHSHKEVMRAWQKALKE